MGVKLEDLLRENNKNKLLEDKSKKTINVMLILIGVLAVVIVIAVLIAFANSINEKEKERATLLSTDIDLISAKIKNIYAEYRATGNEALLVGVSQEEERVEPMVLKGEEYKYGYYYLGKDEIKKLISTINIEEPYLVNYSTGDAVNTEGVKYKGKKYYSVDDLKAIRDGITPPSDYTIYITTAEDMKKLHEYPNNYFKLCNNIDMSTYATGDGWKPVEEFNGRFDGRGYTISNLVVSRTMERYCGLFGQVKSGAVINNLKLKDVNISGGEFTGAIAGACSGSVSNCQVSGRVSGTSFFAGGAFGIFENGLVQNVVSTVSVNGGENVGGFVGAVTSGTIQCCSANGSVNGTKNVGGFVGKVNPSGTTKISQSYTQTEISSTEVAGGFVGIVEIQNSSNLRIEDSYSKGKISFCDRTVGGFVGSIKANISTNFEFYHVYTTVDTPKECKIQRGGFAGDIVTGSGGGAILCYWEKENAYDYDLESVGETNNLALGFDAQSPDEMRRATIFANWDLEKVWKIARNDTPVLRWQ